MEYAQENDVNFYVINECPACGTPNSYAESILGNLGDFEWHRCRYCGSEFFEKLSANALGYLEKEGYE